MVYDMLDKTLVGEDKVDYCITLVASRFSYLHNTSDLHDIAATRGRLYEDVRVGEFTFNNILLSGRLVDIMEGLGDIFNTNGEVVCGRN